MEGEGGSSGTERGTLQRTKERGGGGGVRVSFEAGGERLQNHRVSSSDGRTGERRRRKGLNKQFNATPSLKCCIDTNTLRENAVSAERCLLRPPPLFITGSDFFSFLERISFLQLSLCVKGG